MAQKEEKWVLSWNLVLGTGCFHGKFWTLVITDKQSPKFPVKAPVKAQHPWNFGTWFSKRMHLIKICHFKDPSLDSILEGL